MNPSCPLCRSSSTLLYETKGRTYYKCSGCCSAFLNPANHLKNDEERNRYAKHQNNVNDNGYLTFVKPLIDVVTSRLTEIHRGLDFGAGAGSALWYILQQKGYNIAQFDPYFHNYPDLLQNQYEYIVCCEVIEHFYNPSKEFAMLRQMLSRIGELICMTHLFDDSIDFTKWYYKNDSTHVFFYHPKAIEYIAKKFNFETYSIANRIVIFEV